MGIFSDFLGGTESCERRLEQEYAAAFRAEGSNADEALRESRDFVSCAKKKVQELGWDKQRPNLGDWYLEQEPTDPNIHASLQSLRAEGVTNEDIRWWWNLPPIEKMALQMTDEANRMAYFLGVTEQGMSGEDGAKEMWKAHPKFGYEDHGTDDDRPLPIELKKRIVEFVERQCATPEIMRARLERASSFNAVIRDAIRQGEL